MKNRDRTRALQVFSREKLLSDMALPKDEIAKFLDDFQSIIHGDEGKRKLISLRVPEKLMRLFKEKAARAGRPYQTQIVELMRIWVTKA